MCITTEFLFIRVVMILSMEIAYIIASILQTIAVSLGVGCSTVAVAQFFVAIADGKIDEVERRMMGMVYILLRVAMGLILLATLAQSTILYSVIGLRYINPFTVGIWTVIAVLFVNAILMTMRIMPSKFGPGIQAGSWYTLGVTIALVPLGLTDFSYQQFFLAFAGMMILAIAIVNGVMNYQKKVRA